MIRRALFALGAALVMITGPGRLLWQLARERDRATERRRAERERLQAVPSRTQERHRG